MISLLLLAALCFWPLRATLEHRLLAFWLELTPAAEFPAAPIVMVAIDEDAIDTLGPWPWPRATWAELLRRLHQQHSPRQVALDVVFPQDANQAEGNAAMAQALLSSPAVLGQLLLPEASVRGTPGWTDLTTPAVRDLDELSAATRRFPGLLGNASELVGAARIGHINAQIDVDGRMRRLPNVLCTQSELRQCSISLFQAMVDRLLIDAEWQLLPGRWWQAHWLLVPTLAPELGVPMDARLNVLIPWQHPAALPYVSVADLWEERLPDGILDQQILLFGGVSLGLGDIVTTPLRQTVPGMEVHAQLMRDWFRNRLPYEPRGGPVLATLLTLVLALTLLHFAHRRLRLWLLLLLIPGLMLGLSASAWLATRAYLPLAAPTAFLTLATITLIVQQAFRERREILSRVEPYLPAPLRRLLTRQLLRIPDETGWGTIMVADIVGYTRQSRRLPLESLASWCDQGIDHMLRHAQAEGGMLDNVAGDGALLLWRQGSDMDQAQAACRAARAILAGLPDLNQRLAARGLPPLALGIGIHAGPYLLGTFGQGQKRYTVVSEAANLAAHIERQTRHHAWPVLLSQTVAQALDPGQVEAVAQLPIDGQRNLKLYTLTDLPAYHWPISAPPPAPSP